MCGLAALVGAVRGAGAAAGAAPLVWPGGVITVGDAALAPGARAAVAAAAAAWNRARVGIRFRLAAAGEVRAVSGAGRCLGARAGSATRGFAASPTAQVVLRSCPGVVLPLLAAHELGRVLGLPVDDGACSLMNSFGWSDGRHVAVPGRCSPVQPPPWLPNLVDPRSIAVARALYAAPQGPLQLALTAGTVPRLTWRLPPSSGAAWDVVVRGDGRCPTDYDVAAHSLPIVYRKPAYAGVHLVLDAGFPNVRGAYCYGVFTLSAAGRATRAPAFASFPFDRPPVAAFTFSPSTPAAGQAVTFSDSSSDPDGTIAHWHWDFGDPSSGAADQLDTSDPSQGRGPQHVYAAAGTYTVTLTVTDDGGKQATTSTTVTVS